MRGITMDAGALIAFERNERRVIAMITRALDHRLPITIPAGVVGQVWRDGRRQSRLARLLGADEIDVAVLDDAAARGAGQLCGLRGTSDVIDASVVLGAKSRGDAVMTSDAEDLRWLDPALRLIEV